jgi:hypothetical protein
LSHPLTIAVLVALVCAGVVVAMRLATDAAPVPLSRELTTVDAASAAAPSQAVQPARDPSEAAHRPPEPRPHQAASDTGRPALELPTGTEATPESETALTGDQYRDRDAEQRQAELRRVQLRDAERRQVEQRQVAQRDAERRDAERRQVEQRQVAQRDAERREMAPRDAEPRQAGLPDGGPRQAGLPDGGPRQAGLPDGGPRQAGPPDGGPGDIDSRYPDPRTDKRTDTNQMREDMAGAICSRYGISAGYCRAAASRYGG